MKIIMVYSGKGGVGKTTVSCLLAKHLADKGFKTYLLDADLNTPSVNVIIKKPIKNLTIDTTGTTNNFMVIHGAMTNNELSKSINKIKEINPDYVIIDTPPSITDIHLTVLQKLNISGVVLVSQPTELSFTDVNRTAGLFGLLNIPVIGLVINMDEGGAHPESKFPILWKIPYNKEHKENNVLSQSENVPNNILKTIESLDNVSLKEIKIMEALDNVTEEDIIQLVINARGPYRSKNEKIKFYNTATWDFIRRHIMEDEGPISDRLLMETTTDRIRRVLDCFKHGNNTSMFRIVRSPATEVTLLPSEVGQARLILGVKSYYGIPRVEYHTNKGDVILFPHEIMPVTMEDIERDLEEGFIPTQDNRFIPSFNTIWSLYDAFGSRVGLGGDWIQQYVDIAECYNIKINKKELEKARKYMGETINA